MRNILWSIRAWQGYGLGSCLTSSCSCSHSWRGLHQHFTPAPHWLLEFLTLAMGVVCIARVASCARQGSAIPDGLDANASLDSVLVAMNIVVLSDVQRLLTAPGTGLALLMLLALGTFVAVFILHGRSAFSASSWHLLSGDRMADIICSLFDLGRRSSCRDYCDVLLESQRRGHSEAACKERVAGECSPEQAPKAGSTNSFSDLSKQGQP